MIEKISELAHIRNKLVSGKVDDTDIRELSHIKNKISLLNTPFKDIALNAIDNCEKNIKANLLSLAAQEIQLIHNFNFRDPQKWDESYFYKIELLSYLENVEDVMRIKKLIFLLAKLQNDLANFKKS